MWIFPVLLDCRPEFLPRAHSGSLLLAPLGDGTVLSHLRQRVALVTNMPPVIVTRFPIRPAYEQAVREVCPDVEFVETLPAFAERAHSYEPSDHLLLTDPTCFPLDPLDPSLTRLKSDDDQRGVRHLVAVHRGGEGTREYIDSDASGRIRAIQRYYESVTWPVGGGVACSLVTVASVRGSLELPLADLPRLRRILAAEGAPSRDLPLVHGAVNLSHERGLLAMNERVALSLSRRSRNSDSQRLRARAGSKIYVDPSASLVGPVVLQDDVQIREYATVIGPSVIGKGAIVGPGATLAQCVVGAGQVVVPGATLRHRVFLGGPEGAAGKQPATDLAEPWETDPLAGTSEVAQPSIYPAVKRSLDATVAGLTLLMLSPLLLLLTALVKLTTRGPSFFGHVREGRGGRPFHCWKFRTMFHGADQQQRRLLALNQVDGPQFKVKKDPRRTPIGHWLTVSNLDELPQLWNVLVGQMSLVGPRPSPFRENQVCVPWREGRLSVRPGITGLWQICRHDRDKGDFHQWIYYDLLYVRNVSAWLDLKIIAFTLVALLRGGSIPLSWVLSPSQYGERRSNRRVDSEAPEVAASRRAQAS